MIGGTAMLKNNFNIETILYCINKSIPLPAVDCSTIPQWSRFDFIGQHLDMINKHATKWCFNSHHQKTGTDLKNPANQTWNISQQYWHTIPQTEENSDYQVKEENELKKSIIFGYQRKLQICHVQNAPTIPKTLPPYFKYHGCPSSGTFGSCGPVGRDNRPIILS